jgi:hypothetical protein
MREIKFRAWDKSWGIMRYDLTITNEYWSYTKGTFSCGANHETLMRFTGMKDKNGKEIWEGDILKETLNDECDPCPLWVVGWYVDDITCGWNTDPSSTWYSEVIGNIYENPELLS